jgi:aminoglycoside/choline kinase family phosphotransferase
MKQYALIATALMLSAFSSPHTDTQVESACLGQLKSCFALSDESRDLCFQRTSRTAECLEDAHGQLAAKRATFSSIAPEGSEDVIPTPDANLIDRECVQNFDNFWLSNIVNGSVSQDTLANLHGLLATCTKSASLEMMRP